VKICCSPHRLANSYYQDTPDYTDEWGIGWRSVEYNTPFGKGRYTEMTATRWLMTAPSVATYPTNRPDLYKEAAWVLQTFKDAYWIVGCNRYHIFETAGRCAGYERMLSDFALEPDLAEQILEIPYRYHLQAAKKLVEMGVDMIWTGDDVGAQNAMLISPKMWRRF